MTDSPTAGHFRANAKNERLVGRSSVFLELMQHVARVATTNLPVLLTGEPGTEKELIAAAIHQRGPLADRPFIIVNCATIHETTELIPWGRANGVTVFFDEITEMSPAFQAKLMAGLESSELRVIAATDHDLEREVVAGRFRDDLFRRLNAESITLPPLRERRQDIPLLAESIAERLYSLSPRVKFADEALALLQVYNWPGNIRELEQVIVRAAALSDGTIRGKDLPQRVRQYAAAWPEVTTTNGNADHSAIEDWVPLSEIEGRYVAKVLEHTRGNKQAAARVLGVDRKTLDRMIKRHNIETRSLRARAKTTSVAANSMPYH